MHIYYELTHRCNLQCDYCYNNSGLHNSDPEMCYADIFRSIMRLNQVYGMKSMTLSGGEPLLHKRFSDIVNLLYGLNIHTYVITNGTLLNDYSIDFFSKIDTVQLSIHSGFERYVNMDLLKSLALKTKLVFNVVLNHSTVGLIDYFGQLAIQIGCRLSYRIQKSVGRGDNGNLLTIDDALWLKAIHPKVFDALFNVSGQKCCYFSKEYDVYTMDPMGNITLCPSLSPKYMLGNVFEDWYDNKENALSVLDSDIKEYRESVCGKCFLKSHCLGICPGEYDNYKGRMCLDCLIKNHVVINDMIKRI